MKKFEDIAEKALREEGLEGYWAMLSRPPKKPANRVRQTPGKGYEDPPFATRRDQTGTGHNGDSSPPLDKLFK